MNLKTVVLASIFFTFSICKIFAQADPGTGGMELNKSILKVNETAILYVSIGNFAARLVAGKAVTPNDARFTITLPAELRVNGTIDKSQLPFTASISILFDPVDGLTKIVVTVPNGIPKGAVGDLIIPVIAHQQSVDIVTLAWTLVESNLSSAPSGNAWTSNDMSSAPVAVFTALPVTLAAFDVKTEGLSANLTWSTTEETGSDRFDIEHSTNGKQWSKIGSVISGGESIVKRDYAFSHTDPTAGNNYYRLKMVDKNLTFAYSNMRNVQFESTALVTFPNPTSEMLTIETTGWQDVVNVQLINSNGAALYNSGRAPQRTLDVRAFSSGIYFVKITKSDGSTSSQKVMVKR